MSIARDVYVDDRIVPPLELERLTADGFPNVYIAPSDRPDEPSEIGSGEDFARVSRAELREWAEAILHTLRSS